MCELLGMAFNLPVRPQFSFTGFRRRGVHNPDGWGLAYYPDTSAQVFKEPSVSTKSRLSEFVLSYDGLRSKIIVAHVRKASSGSKSHENTHPFSRELGGKEYVFAHNGTLHDYDDLALGRFKPMGATDSEHVFCHLLNSIADRGIAEWTPNDFGWLSTKLAEVNKHGHFNCLLSDGVHLLCYRDKDGYNGLVSCRRESPFVTVRLQNEDLEVNLDEEKDPRQRGYIVASKPLTDERWQEVPEGRLLVISGGEIVFQSSGDSGIATTAFTDTEVEVLRLLRSSKHRLSMKQIADRIEDSTRTRAAIASLLHQRYICQDSRDRVGADEEQATFYTNPLRKDEVNQLIAS